MSSLSPLDLLSMSDREQDVLRCLTKQPSLGISEIAGETNIPVDELEIILNEMVQESRLVEQLKDGSRTFSVRFSAQRTKIRNIPKDILNIYEKSLDDFLAKSHLLSVLTVEERDRLLEMSNKRTTLPDEVVVWQGKPFEYIGLVQSGLLKRSRLQGAHKSSEADGYTRNGEWFGLTEAISHSVSAHTYTAVTPTKILVWPAAHLLDFVNNNARFSYALNEWLSYELALCQSQHVRGVGKLWVVDAIHEGAGATELSLNLACTASQNGVGLSYKPRVIVWDLSSDARNLQHRLGINNTQPPIFVSETEERIISHEGGFDILLPAKKNDYPPQVQLDILLTKLQNQYDYIICDSGSNSKDEFLLRLRGHADTLLTTTTDATHSEKGAARWRNLQPYAHPAQRRLLILNCADPKDTTIPSDFHMVLPTDEEAAQLAREQLLPLVQAVPSSSLSLAIEEVCRRLSLTHSIGLFIPSTVDVNTTVNNAAQVQSALSFLGSIFGGATSSEAEGVWRSEDSGLVTEQVTIVRTFVSKLLLEKHLDDVIRFATDLKEEMKQEAVALDIDNQLILV